MLLVFLYLAILSLGLSSAASGRLREFFDSVKEFANENGEEPSTAVSKNIIESAVRFANNDGRPLDMFIDVLQSVHKNHVTKAFLDRLAWDAVGELFKSAVNKVHVDELKDSASAGPPTAPCSKKRGLGSGFAPESRLGDNRKRVLSILTHLRSLPGRYEPARIGLNMKLQNYIHYKMVENGEYERLLYNLELLGATPGLRPMQSAFHVFRDAYEKMVDPSFVIRDKRLDEALADHETFHLQAYDLDRFLAKLETVMQSAPEYKRPCGRLHDMEAIIFEMAQRRDVEGLNRALMLHENANAPFVRRRALFQRAYDLLKNLKPH